MPTIQALREARGWSQHELAEKVGVSGVTIYFWESGRREPKVSHLRKLADVFGVTMDAVTLLDTPAQGRRPGRPPRASPAGR